MSSSIEQLHAERAAFVKRFEESKRELDQIRANLKARQDHLSALEERRAASQEQLQKVTGLLQDTEAKKELVGPELTARLMGPLEVELRALRAELQKVDAELKTAHAEAAQVAQSLGPAFQKQQRFEEVLSSLDEMIKASGAPAPSSQPAPPARSTPLPPPTASAPLPAPTPTADSSDDVKRPVRVPLRTSISFELQVHQDSEHNFYTGFTDNISEGGLFIASEQRIDLGTEISFKLELPTLSGPQDLKGVVRWVRYSDDPQEGSPNGVGVQFLELTPNVKASIERFISQRESIFYDE